MPLYWLLKDDLVKPSTNIEELAKEADDINGIIVIVTGPEVSDFSIVYVGGESKVLSNIK